MGKGGSKAEGAYKVRKQKEEWDGSTVADLGFGKTSIWQKTVFSYNIHSRIPQVSAGK
jgi:hypothetical protein